MTSLYFHTYLNSQDFLLGGGALPPLAGADEELSDEEDPRAKHRAKASAKAKPVVPLAPPVGPPALVRPPLLVGPSAVPPVKAGALSPPSSPEFLVGGSSSSGAIISPATVAAASKGKAKSKAIAKPRMPKNAVHAIGEGFVYYMEYKAPFKTTSFGNWTFYCRREGCPSNCRRTLGVIPKNTQLLKSDLEPLAFLHAWRDCVIDPTLGHRKSQLAEADVTDFFDDHHGELVALRDVFYSP